jgi:hypothetical protein
MSAAAGADLRTFHTHRIYQVYRLHKTGRSEPMKKCAYRTNSARRWL